MSTTVARLTTALAGRYRIERELGRGGMATVYLAHDERHDRDVAIKVLHPELGAALGGDRFLAEIKTTARLQHPHILALLDSGEADGLLFYVMPYVQGETLRGRLTRETQLPVDDALRIAREVADALGAAHALGIVHRDIKPENILLQAGHALVADFGIALAVQSAGGSRMTQTGLSLGTPQYMAPEQAMGEKAIDARADLYALGAVLYEMLTGEPPFTGASVQAIVARVMTEQPRGLVAQRKAVGPVVEAAVLRALEKLPADRFASAAEFVTALAAPSAATVPSRATPGAGLRFAVVALAAAALVGVTWTVARRGDAAAASTTARSLAIALPDSVRVAFNGAPELSGGLGSLALSRNGSRLIWIATGAKGVRLMERALDSYGFREIPGSTGAYGPFISDDGAVAGFFVGNELRTYRFASGESRTVLRSVAEAAGATFLPDGRIFVTRAFQVPQLVTPSGAVRDLVEAGSSLTTGRELGIINGPRAVPGGRFATGASRSGRLMLVDVETGRPRFFRATYASAGADNAINGRSPIVAGDLMYWSVRDVVVAARVDLANAAVTTEPVEVASGVRGDLDGIADFTVADDGTIAFVPGADADVGYLAWIDARGRVDTLPLNAGRYGGWDIARDGRLVTIERAVTIIASGSRRGRPMATSEVRLHDLKARSSQRIGANLLFIGQATWTADGNGLIATTVNPDASHPQAVRFAVGGAARVDTLIRETEISRTAVARDGSLAVLSVMPVEGRDSTGNDQVDLYVSTAGGAFAKVAHPRRVRTPALSPDGRWLAYEDFDGRNNVVLEPVPADGRIFAVSDSGGYEPIFSAQGDKIFYRTGHRIMVTTFTAGATPVIGKPATYVAHDFADFPGRAWAVAPDGRLLVKLLPSTEPQREIRVVVGARTRATGGGR